MLGKLARAKESASGNIARGAMTLLVSVIVLALATLVGGKFLGAIPTDGVFGSQVGDIESYTGTALTIFAVTLLIIPAAVAVAYVYSNLGAVLGMGRGR